MEIIFHFVHSNCFHFKFTLNKYQKPNLFVIHYDEYFQRVEGSAKIANDNSKGNVNIKQKLKVLPEQLFLN